MIESAALATWQRRAMLIGVGTLLAVLCAAFLIRALVTQFRRLANSEASIAEREARLADKSRELECANLRLDAALNNMSQGLCMFDGTRAPASSATTVTFEMYGLPSDTRSARLHASASCSSRADRRRHLHGRPDLYVAALRAQVAAGPALPISPPSSPTAASSRSLNQPMPNGGWVATHEDITERQRSEARIAHMARHDALTDLANRVLFREKMDEALAQLRPHRRRLRRSSCSTSTCSSR